MEEEKEASASVSVTEIKIETNETVVQPVVSKPTEYSPRKIAPRIKAAPSIRQIYWCDFELDPILPEIGKTRPVVIVSFKNVIRGHCLVLPISTEDQTGESAKWAHKLANELEPGKTSWVVCNHLYTVSTARLQPLLGKVVPRLSEEEFEAILAKMFAWLPKAKT